MATRRWGVGVCGIVRVRGCESVFSVSLYPPCLYLSWMDHEWASMLDTACGE